MLEKLARDCPDMPDYEQALGDGLLALGELRLAAGRQTDGQLAFDRAIKLFRKSNHAGRLRSGTGRPLRPRTHFVRAPAVPRSPRAVEVSRRAASRFPHNTRLKSLLGVACYRTGDWKGAVAALSDGHILLTPRTRLTCSSWQWRTTNPAKRRKPKHGYDRAAALLPRAARTRATQRLQAEAKELFGRR